MINSVCIFGDSVAKGVIFDAAKNKYCLLKESFANLVQKQQNIAITNYARFGCTITAGSAILAKHQSKLNQFDYTILEFGGNDCDFNWQEVSKDPFGAHLCNTPADLFREQYTALIDRVRKNGGNPVLLSLPPIDAKRYFKWISKGLNAKNIMAFLGEVETIYRWQEMYSNIIQELSLSCKAPMIDIRSVFSEKKDFSDYLCEDGIHPNEKGHQLISEAIEKEAFL
ncbi:SGNH/GDSL hydrolase family protein [Sinanaerobacter chloroacetimidivorans]|uniref:SGNH/GDSL hydrolase family protein n=1 Tax=Sinanaerobacter chloroacetimidivorans TaxID=2818044 RepID=A0A8J8B0P7_9FIRM|nr:SGNH/GDSL hydrolase family protein [Sinanaerobacter chloroacetimidivorans]MBR0597833.1 SGNH/GDSL hydrolase family protein [Sinanaerobacter chloroacetimidivorans]